MNKKKIIKTCMIVCISALLAACGSSPAATPTIDPLVVMTDVAGTIQAEITQSALLTPSATIASPPTSTPLPIPTQPLPSAPTTPAGTAPALPAELPDNLLFLQDITYPDGTVVWQNERFTKTWNFENNGTTTWDSSYSLVYWDSDPKDQEMFQEGQEVIPIINPVEPGNQLTISVKMTAPAALGTYINYYRMVNGEGQAFGDSLYVQIRVGTTEDKTPVPTG
jgi:hypothetical protein